MEWQQDAKELLEVLVKPIPPFVRSAAKKKIEKSIIAASEGKPVVTVDEVAHGYIAASSGKMREKAIKVLQAQGVDVSQFENV